MHRITLFLFLLFPGVWGNAQRTVIAGKFPYQRNVPFSAEQISNQIILVDEWGKIADTSDASGSFHTVIDLKAPGFVRFTQRENVELYLRPGDSLWVEMINGRNMKFSGSAGPENELLHKLQRPFIPLEIQENPEVYSALVDTFFQNEKMRLEQYQQAGSVDEGFCLFYQALALGQFLEDKIRILKFMEQQAWEGALKDRIERQIHNSPFLDEVRPLAYTNTLHSLLHLEVLQILGQDWSSQSSGFNLDEPIGYSEVFQRHWEERLAGYPRLKKYFQLEKWIAEIQGCYSAQALPNAAKQLEQIKMAVEYPALIKEMEHVYRKKVIQFQIGKLPPLLLENTDGTPFEFNAPLDQKTMVVFWDADDMESNAAYQRFQEKSDPQFPRFLADSLQNAAQHKSFIWIQLGGDVTTWKQAITKIPATYPVQHFRLREKNDLQTIQAFLYEDKPLVAYSLKPDLSIESISNYPSALEPLAWNIERVGGRIIWRQRRE